MVSLSRGIHDPSMFVPISQTLSKMKFSPASTECLANHFSGASGPLGGRRMVPLHRAS